MAKLFRIFVTGMVISFIGSLPLGTLNIAAMQIGISQGVLAALLFAAGSLMAEMVYVRLSLVAMDWIRKQQAILKALEWVTFVIVAALAISSFYSAVQQHPQGNAILTSTLPPFLLGLFMSALNPVQIPFWFGWSTVLFSKKVLEPKADHYNVYIFGIGLGTLMGNCVFIFGGRLVADTINHNENILNWVIGSVFAITAVIQLIKILRNKGAQHQVEHPEELARKFEDQFNEVEPKQ